MSECNFNPEIHNNYINDKRTIENVVKDSDSCNLFLRKKQIYREKKQILENELNNRPGNGNIWIKKITVPQPVNLNTSKQKYFSYHTNNSKLDNSKEIKIINIKPYICEAKQNYISNMKRSSSVNEKTFVSYKKIRPVSKNDNKSLTVKLFIFIFRIF